MTTTLSSFLFPQLLPIYTAQCKSRGTGGGRLALVKSDVSEETVPSLSGKGAHQMIFIEALYDLGVE